MALTSMFARDVFVVDAIRTPVGRRGGSLAGVHPVDLAATVLGALVDRAGIDPSVVDDVILGCVNAIGAQAGNIARVSWLAAGLPATVPGVTVDRRCGSAQQAITFAAQAIAAGSHDVVVAGGVESMSVVPIGSPVSLGQQAGYGHPYLSQGWISSIGPDEVSQFRGAEIVAADYGITRAQMEAFALESYRRAVDAVDDGRFDKYLIPLAGLRRDECLRRSTSLEKMAALPPVLEGGTITAATSSQIADGAGVLLLVSGPALERYALTPLARIISMAVVGADPVRMVDGPVPATRRALDRVGLAVRDIDRFEVNEAFAPVVLMWADEVDASLAATNVNGGAIALGHPLGASGARLMADLIHELHRADLTLGLQTMCEGAGTASATIVERC
jgi:acetyl-CoA C-acetyltransferase